MYSRNCATVRRLNVLQRILANNNKTSDYFFAGQSSLLGIQRNLVRAINIDGKVTIDDVSKDVRPPKNPEYVPQKFRKYNCYSIDFLSTLSHWKMFVNENE